MRSQKTSPTAADSASPTIKAVQNFSTENFEMHYQTTSAKVGKRKLRLRKEHFQTWLLGRFSTMQALSSLFSNLRWDQQRSCYAKQLLSETSWWPYFSLQICESLKWKDGHKITLSLLSNCQQLIKEVVIKWVLQVLGYNLCFKLRFNFS